MQESESAASGLRSFAVTYRFGGRTKHTPLPEWLADSLDDRFEGDLGLIQTTRLPVHQTKVRLLAAAIDAVEQAEDREIGLGEVDAALVERGLLLCVERHRPVWRDLVHDKPLPSFAHAFELYAEDASEPAFMQCPVPEGASTVARERGIKLLPDFGFAVPSLVEAQGDTELAFQLMAFAGKLQYVKMQAKSSRPLGQAISIDVPGQPAWRVRHEVESTLTLAADKDFRAVLGLCGGVVFAWLLPYLPSGRPIPRYHQHPMLLDVAMPVRIVDDRRSVYVFSKPYKIGGGIRSLGEKYLPTSALGPGEVYPASCVPTLRLRPFDPKCDSVRRKGGKERLKDEATYADLGPGGYESCPLFVQKPYAVQPPSVSEIVRLIRSARTGSGESHDKGYPPTLDIHRGNGSLRLPLGAELVIQGELASQSVESKTKTWLDIRIPLPDPDTGGFRSAEAWEFWVECCENQLKESDSKRTDLRARIRDFFCYLRSKACYDKSTKKTRAAADKFAITPLARFDREEENQFWTIASRTWQDKAKNEREWYKVLMESSRSAAKEAFEALGGFDDPATVMAAARSGLLQLIDRREAA